MSYTDKEIIAIFQEVDLRGVPSHLKSLQTWCWKKILIRHEKLLFSTMNKKGGVSNIAFKDHPLYAELAMAIKYAMKNFKFEKNIKVNTFLVNTFRIFITRYYTSPENKSVNQEVSTEEFTYDDTEADDKEKKYERLFKEENADIHVPHDKVTETFIKRLYCGASCKKPYKLVEIYKIIPECHKHRETIKDISSRN